MALTDKDKKMLGRFWAETKRDISDQIQFALMTKAQQKAEVQAWWDAKKTKLQADKDVLTQSFINDERAKVDTQITDGDDLLKNL